MFPDRISMNHVPPACPTQASLAGRPGFWIWPFRLSSGRAKQLLAAADKLAGMLNRFHLWIPVGALIGAVPLWFAFHFGLRHSHLATAVLLVPFVVAAASRDATLHGVTLLIAAFLSHNVTAIGLTMAEPEAMSRWFPAGDAYWRESRAWIMTGESPEYDLSWWVPAHFQLLAGSTFFSYTSFGAVTLQQGFHEVDLMNVYVGRLLAECRTASPGLWLAWHPWSICRGCGYVLLTFEVVSFSLSRLTGASLSTRKRRLCRWVTGIGFLTMDAVLKLVFLEPVRRVLASHLLSE